MSDRTREGAANLSAVATLAGLVIAAVWIWKRLTPETQEYVIDRAVPLAAAGITLLLFVWLVVRKLRRGAARRRERDRLLAAFQRETAPDKKLQLSFRLAEVNGYRIEGLEPAIPALKDLWVTTLRRALGDEQHRIRGMAASHLGVLRDTTVVPLLLTALDDDHAYVRSCAALGLGRLRAAEARAKLTTVMEEDWDQTVRSRAREALERITPP